MFGPCFVMQYLPVVSFLVLQLSCGGRESWFSSFHVAVSGLCLFLTVLRVDLHFRHTL